MNYEQAKKRSKNTITIKFEKLLTFGLQPRLMLSTDCVRIKVCRDAGLLKLTKHTAFSNSKQSTSKFRNIFIDFFFF